MKKRRITVFFCAAVMMLFLSACGSQPEAASSAGSGAEAEAAAADRETFYQETLTYVENLKAAGVEAACDVYPSDTHAFDMLYPERPESRLAAQNFAAQFAKHLG